MTMTHAEAIQRLAQIGLKPTTTMRDSLTIARHVLRRTCAYRESIREERHTLRRKARKLRQFEPFTKLAADTMEQQARDHDAERLANVRTILLTYGQSLIHDRDGYMAALGFDAVCDLLNVNRVDRERARREGWHTLSDLVGVHDLENSAERRGDEWGSGSPLYQACHLALMEFIRECPAHLLPDPFEPGAPLGPKQPPALRIVEK